MPQNNKDENNIDFAFKIMSTKFQSQNGYHVALENKIGTMLGFVGIITASIIAVVQTRTGLLGLNIFTLGVIGMFITLWHLVDSSQTRKYLDSPDFSCFYTEESLNKSACDLKNQVISDMKSSFEKNNEIQNKKAKLYNFAIHCFLLSILFLFLGILEK